MIGLLQRVCTAKVEIDNRCIAEIANGLLVLVAVESNDSDSDAKRLAERLCGYRVFADASGKMNLSVKDVDGGLLLVPQFTLAADTDKGMRPSFHTAANPETGQQLFFRLVEYVTKLGVQVQTGQFGADMQVTLTNDGPVTFWIKTKQAV